MDSVADTSAYIDLDSDEIMHWKYIKREKLANGKYRYYYDQSGLDLQEQSALKAEQEVDNAYRRVDEAKSKLDIATSAMQKARSNGNRKIPLNQVNAMRLKVNEAYADLKIAEIKLDETKQSASKTISKYSKERLISLPARAISKGIVSIVNLFSKSNKSTETMADLVKKNRNEKRINRNYKNVLGLTERPKAHNKRASRKNGKYF